MAETTDAGLRMPEHMDTPCQTCNRKFLKAEAHWFCSICRKNDPRAMCPEGCKACLAMEEEEWRKKASLEAEYKRENYYRNKNKNKSSPSSFMFCGKRKGSKAKGSLAKRKIKIKTKLGQPKQQPQVLPIQPPKKPSELTPYDLRLQDFESFLYEELNPMIPNNLVEAGFTLPEVPPHLKNKYNVARWELIRLLATSSMCYHLSKNRSQFCDENNQIFNANSDGIVSLFASLIKFKANTLGKIIFEIRSTLLKEVACKDSNVISQMINGPIKPKESFFGNIDVLKELVSQDAENVLRVYKPSETAIKMEEPSSDEQEFENFSNYTSDSSN